MITRFVKLAVQETLSNFREQSGLEFAFKGVSLDGAPNSNMTVVSKIDLVSKQIDGHLGLLMPTKLFLAYVSELIGEKVEELEDDFLSAGTEFLNILYGSVKTAMEEFGVDFDTSLPENVPLASVSLLTAKYKCIVLTFTAADEEFYVNVYTSKT